MLRCLSRPLQAIATALLLTHRIALVAADGDFPQQVNISLIFPRNETYDTSSGILPVIFALTNPVYAVNLNAQMSTRIFSEGNRTNNGTIELGILYLDNPLLDSYDASLNSVTYSGDNVYVYFAALNMIGREGAFYLRYSIDLWTGMPETKPYLGEYYSGFEPVSSLSYGSIGFTLKNGSGASLTDLVAGTANTSCADVPLSWPLTITKLVNQTCSETVPIFTKPGETCVFLSNDTQGVVADYDGPYPFVNMTTTGYGCAPTMDKAAAAAVESTMAVQACFAAGNTTTCITNSTGVPNNGFTTVSVPGVAAMMTIVMGIVTGALLI